MKVVAIVIVTTILLYGCTGNEERGKGPRLFISGDEQSIGADVYIDGQKVGVMVKGVYSGPKPSEEDIKNWQETQRRFGIKPTMPSNPGDIGADGIDLRIATGERTPDYGIYRQIRVPMGEHELLVINKEGISLKKKIKVQSENYLYVDFERMVIRGDE